MNRGKWYLCYVVFDGLENRIAEAMGQKRVDLKATDEKVAVEEATNLWKQKLAKGTYEGWDGNTYPHSPCVTYEIPLQ